MTLDELLDFDYVFCIRTFPFTKTLIQRFTFGTQYFGFVFVLDNFRHTFITLIFALISSIISTTALSPFLALIVYRPLSQNG